MRYKERKKAIEMIKAILERKYLDREDKRVFENLKVVLEYDEWLMRRRKNETTNKN